MSWRGGAIATCFRVRGVSIFGSRRLRQGIAIGRARSPHARPLTPACPARRSPTRASFAASREHHEERDRPAERETPDDREADGAEDRRALRRRLHADRLRRALRDRRELLRVTARADELHVVHTVRRGHDVPDHRHRRIARRLVREAHGVGVAERRVLRVDAAGRERHLRVAKQLGYVRARRLARARVVVRIARDERGDLEPRYLHAEPPSLGAMDARSDEHDVARQRRAHPCFELGIQPVAIDLVPPVRRIRRAPDEPRGSTCAENSSTRS